MRIGLIGGSFDPVHTGNLLLAEGARETLRLDRVIWIPAAAPPHKSAGLSAPVEERVRMVELAIEGNPAFEVSRIELERSGPSYTIDTVRRLREIHPGADNRWFFLIGSDTAAELSTWRSIDELRKLVEFAAAPRPGSRGLATPWVTELDVRTLAVSASEIRARVQEGRSIRYLVPEPVRAAIERKGLYR